MSITTLAILSQGSATCPRAPQLVPGLRNLSLGSARGHTAAKAPPSKLIHKHSQETATRCEVIALAGGARKTVRPRAEPGDEGWFWLS
jgi:hypothetical protein